MLDVLIDREDVKLLRVVRTRMTSHNQKSVQNCDRQYLLSRMVIDAANIVCRAVYKTIEHLSLVGRRSGGFAAEPRAVRSRAGSVSVFKSRYRFFKISRFRFFSARTYHCLSNNTIADTLRPPLFPEWGLGPRICITNCGHKR